MIRLRQWLALIGLTLLLTVPAYGGTVLQVLEVTAEAPDTTSSQAFAPINSMELSIVTSGSAVAVGFDGDFTLCNESGIGRYVGGTVKLMDGSTELRRFRWIFWAQASKCISLPGNIFEIDASLQPPASYYDLEWATVEAVKTSMTVSRRRLKLVELQ